MELSEMLNIKILPVEISSSLYKIEKGLFHLPYKDEVKMFNCVKEGDLQKLIKRINSLNNISVGKMADDLIQQYKYMAVSSITLATRYAIEGGLSEEDAYAYSDLFIKKVDECDSADSIIQYVAQGVIKLTNSVAEEKNKLRQSPHVRKCITYINKNLNKRITIADLAAECNLSADYLSHLFKTEMNENLSSYILKKKLETAKQLLLEGMDNVSICNALCFSSQSHFISAFKKEYSITPKEFLFLSK